VKLSIEKNKKIKPALLQETHSNKIGKIITFIRISLLTMFPRSEPPSHNGFFHRNGILGSALHNTVALSDSL